MRAHMATCPVCAAYAAQLEQLRGLLRTRRVVAPPGLLERILELLKSVIPVRRLSCREARELASAYLDDELNRLERETLEAHLFACEACYQEYVAMRTAAQAMRAAPPAPVSAHLRDRILAAVAAVEAEASPTATETEGVLGHIGPRRTIWRQVLTPAAAIAAAALLGIGLFHLTSQPQAPPEPLVAEVRTEMPVQAPVVPAPTVSADVPKEPAEPQRAVSERSVPAVKPVSPPAGRVTPRAPSAGAAAVTRPASSASRPAQPATRSAPGTGERQPVHVVIPAPSRESQPPRPRPERVAPAWRPEPPVVASAGRDTTAEPEHRPRLLPSSRTPDRPRPPTVLSPIDRGLPAPPPPALAAVPQVGVTSSRRIARGADGSSSDTPSSSTGLASAPPLTRPQPQRVAITGSGAEGGSSSPRSAGAEREPRPGIATEAWTLHSEVPDVSKEAEKRVSRIARSVEKERKMGGTGGLTVDF